MTWREPEIPTDCGQERLVRSTQLVDEDYCPNGVCVATVNEDVDGQMYAICATWCGYQDHWHTTEIKEPFEVLEMPE